MLQIYTGSDLRDIAVFRAETANIVGRESLNASVRTPYARDMAFLRGAACSAIQRMAIDTSDQVRHWLIRAVG